MKSIRQTIQEESDKLRRQSGIGNVEYQQALTAMTLQVQLEILDVLEEIRNALEKLNPANSAP